MTGDNVGEGMAVGAGVNVAVGCGVKVACGVGVEQAASNKTARRKIFFIENSLLKFSYTEPEKILTS